MRRNLLVLKLVTLETILFVMETKNLMKLHDFHDVFLCTVRWQKALGPGRCSTTRGDSL